MSQLGVLFIRVTELLHMAKDTQITDNVLYLYLKFKPEAGNLRNSQPGWETVYLCVSLEKSRHENLSALASSSRSQGLSKPRLPPPVLIVDQGLEDLEVLNRNKITSRETTPGNIFCKVYSVRHGVNLVLMGLGLIICYPLYLGRGEHG